MKVGEVVLHPVFGAGVVKSIQERSGLPGLVTVKFKDAERKFQDTTEKITKA